MLAMCLNNVPGSFVDVGVHRLSTYLDLRSFDTSRQYIGIEPNLTSAAIAADVIKLTGDLLAIVLPCAAAKHNGLLDLWVRPAVDHDSCATTIKDLRPGLALERWVAPALTLDTILSCVATSPVALIKIDVEGGELEVLEGALSALSERRPTVLCEVLLRDSQAAVEDYSKRIKRLIDLLREHQYAIYHLDKDGSATKVVKLERVESFSDRIWTKDDQERCDYLFLPEEVRPSGLLGLLS